MPRGRRIEAALCALALAACAEPVAPPASTCGADGSCPSGKQCLQGWCVEAAISLAGRLRRDDAGADAEFVRCGSPGGVAELTPLLAVEPLQVPAEAIVRVDGVPAGFATTGEIVRVGCDGLAGGTHTAIAELTTPQGVLTSGPFEFLVDATIPTVALVSPDLGQLLGRTTSQTIVFAFSEPVTLPGDWHAVLGAIYPRLSDDRRVLTATLPVPPPDVTVVDVVVSPSRLEPIRDDAGHPVAPATVRVTYPPYVPPPTFDVALSMVGDYERIGARDFSIRAIPSGESPERIVLRLTHDAATREEVLAPPAYEYVFNGATEAEGLWTVVASSELHGYTRTSDGFRLFVDRTPPTVARATSEGMPSHCRLTGQVVLDFGEYLDRASIRAEDFSVTDAGGWPIPFQLVGSGTTWEVTLAWAMPSAPNTVRVAVAGEFADAVGNVRSSGELFACDAPVWLPGAELPPTRVGARLRAVHADGPLWEERLAGADTRIGWGEATLDPAGAARRGPATDGRALAYFREAVGGAWSVAVELGGGGSYYPTTTPTSSAAVQELATARSDASSEPYLAWSEASGGGSVVRAFRVSMQTRAWVELPGGPTASTRATAPRVAQLRYEYAPAWFAWLERETDGGPPRAYARKFTSGILDPLTPHTWGPAQALGSAPGLAASPPVLLGSGAEVWVAFAEGEPGARTIRVLAWTGQQFEPLPPIAPELGTDVAEPSLGDWDGLRVGFVETGPGGRWITSARWNGSTGEWERPVPACGPACTGSDPLVTGAARYFWTRDDGALETVELNR